jgi:hypothetical protein
MRIATIQQYAVFTEYLTLLSFESFHICLVEMFTPRQSTVNEATRGIRRSIPMMLCGLLSNLLWGKSNWWTRRLHSTRMRKQNYHFCWKICARAVIANWCERKMRKCMSIVCSLNRFTTKYLTNTKRKALYVDKERYRCIIIWKSEGKDSHNYAYHESSDAATKLEECTRQYSIWRGIELIFSLTTFIWWVFTRLFIICCLNTQ